MISVVLQLERHFYTFCQRKINNNLWLSINGGSRYCLLTLCRAIYCNRDFKRLYCYSDVMCLNMDVSNRDVCDFDLQGQGNESITGCTSISDQEGNTDIESFNLNKLFDMDEVVKNVKMKLKEKSEKNRKMQIKCASSNKQKNKKGKCKRKSSGNCSMRDDSDSSLGLTTMFEQKEMGHKRQKKLKKGNQNVKRNNESYGLDWLFCEKNIGEKKNRRKGRTVNCENSESEEGERDKEIKIKKNRPNHFVAIRISDPTIHRAIEGFQDTIVKANAKLKPALIPLISLHITLAVVHLDESAIKSAENALKKCRDKMIEALKAINFSIIFNGIGNFSNEVVFAKVQEKEQIECLKAINSVVTETFEKEGISVTDKKEYNPHLTLLKLSRKKSLRRNRIKKVEESIYTTWLDSYFGEELVKNIHICSMQAKEEDGFYKCVSTILLSTECDMDNTNAASKEENVDQ